MTNSYKKFNQFISDIEFKSIGSGNFDVGLEHDVYIDDLFLGLTLKNKLLYIYFYNCPGRNYVIYEWNKSRKEFNNFVSIIEELMDRNIMISLAFNFVNKHNLEQI